MVYTVNGEQFTKRKLLKINTAAAALTNYQIKKTVPYLPVMQSGMADIRFTTLVGVNIPYWEESVTADTEADVWMKVPSISNTAPTYIWQYYGNPNVSSASSIDDTFIFGDEFNTGSVPDASKWENPSANNMIVSSGELDTNGVGNSNPTIYGKTDFGAGHAMRIKFKNVIDAESTWFGFVDSTTGYIGINDGAITFHHGTANWFGRYYIGGSETTDSSIWAEDTNVYHIYDIEWLSNSLDYKKDGVSEWNPTATLVGSDLHAAIEGYTVNSDSRVDWVFIRKLAATEPTWAADGAEEHQRRIPQFIN